MQLRKIKVTDKKYLNILWDDGKETRILLSKLRKNCPCANCVMERQKRLPNYIPLLSHAQTTLKDIKVIGSYALQLLWQDGHDEGIFGYDFLKSLSNNE